MRINTPYSASVRDAENTIEDAQFMVQCFSDWPLPAHRYSLSWAMREIENTSLSDDDESTWTDRWMVYETDEGERIGMVKWAYIVGDGESAIQLDMLAIHPAYRGQGRFTEFSEALAWYANQKLHATSAHYEVFEDRAPVLHRAAMRGAVQKEKIISSVPGIDKIPVRYLHDDVAKIIEGQEGFSVRTDADALISRP